MSRYRQIPILALLVPFLAITVHASDPAEENESAGSFSAAHRHTFTLLEQSVAADNSHPALASEASPKVSLATKDVKLSSWDFPKLLVDDAVHILAAPARWETRDWLLAGGAVALIGAVALADTDIRTEVQRHANGSNDDIANKIRPFGSTYSIATLGLFYAGGAAFHDDTAKAVAIDGAASTLVTSGIITPFLKFATGRARPGEQGTHYFKPFSGAEDSFPSAETSQAFAVASVIAAHYDSFWVKAISYGIAGTVGLERIYLDGHWTSDVVAGAVIGTAVGMAIVHYNEKRRKAKKEETGTFITPLLAPGTAGIAITLVR
jgi:membrane-associated phospholipid phosphatase